MAGKSRKQASRPPSPHMNHNMHKVVAEGPRGHMGLKSSPYCVTDSKLISQYMVQDHMAAHYKKIVKAKPAVDTSAPKAWLVSQKVRDQARRAALKNDMGRREAWLADQNQPVSSRPSSRATSEVDRDEMYAMWESFNNGGDVPDGRGTRADDNSTLEVHPPDSQMSLVDTEDMKFVNRIVHDTHNSPSQYHNPHMIRSNIPGKAANTPHKRPTSGRRDQTMVVNGANATHRLNPGLGMAATRTLTPRSKDLLDQNAGHFTDEKPFQPRTLRTNTQSRLSEFKYYNPPKKRNSVPAPEPTVTAPSPTQSRGVPKGTLRGSVRSLRPGSAMTGTLDSTDLMLNESLMSRDHNQARTPTGVPPLDISLDADNAQWLQEQSNKAHARSRAILSQRTATLQHTATRPEVGTLNQTRPMSSRHDDGSYYPSSATWYRVSLEEEELQYLEFITEVTNDVLDRGIFTNRVLKQVFQSHIERRKGDLKVSRMRELLAELQRDLGIPPADLDKEDGVGMATMPGYDTELQQTSMDELVENGIKPLRLTEEFDGNTTTQKMPPGGRGRPPLPRTKGPAVGRSRTGSANSALTRDSSKEEPHSPPPDDGLGEMTFGMTMKRDGAMQELQAALVATLQQKADAETGSDEETNREGRASRADSCRSDINKRDHPSPSHKDKSGTSTRRSSQRSQSPANLDKSDFNSRRTSHRESTHRDDSPGIQSGTSTLKSSYRNKSIHRDDSPVNRSGASTPRSSRRNSPHRVESPTPRNNKSGSSTRRSSYREDSPVEDRLPTPRNNKSGSSTRRSSYRDDSPVEDRLPTPRNNKSGSSTRRSSYREESPREDRSPTPVNKSVDEDDGDITRSSHQPESTHRSSILDAYEEALDEDDRVDSDALASARSIPKVTPRKSISSAGAVESHRSVESESIGVSELDEDIDEEF